jgi:hypothetical protein
MLDPRAVVKKGSKQSNATNLISGNQASRGQSGQGSAGGGATGGHGAAGHPDGTAQSGTAGSAGRAGVGIGGGLVRFAGDSASLTNTSIAGNRASTSDNDVAMTSLE